MGDYGRSTGHLSLQDHGAYTLLLDHYYSSRSPLPADLKSARRICGAISKSETKSVQKVIEKFFPMDPKDGLRHNKRCDEEIAKWNSQAIVNAEVAKLGGRPRKTESVTGSVIKAVSESVSESITEQKPSPEVRSQKLEVRSQMPEKPTPLASSPNGLSAGVNGKGVAYIPLVDGTEFGLSEADLEELKKAYPALDCKQTMLEIRAWCTANPTRKKTRRGAMRFINAWMARLQDRAH